MASTLEAEQMALQAANMMRRHSNRPNIPPLVMKGVQTHFGEALKQDKGSFTPPKVFRKVFGVSAWGAKGRRGSPLQPGTPGSGSKPGTPGDFSHFSTDEELSELSEDEPLTTMNPHLRDRHLRKYAEEHQEMKDQQCILEEGMEKLETEHSAFFRRMFRDFNASLKEQARA